MWPVFGTRPSLGLSPKSPHQCAGTRTDAARSLPTSNAERPAATAAAPPPVEPPGVRSRFHGLLVRPKIGLSARPSAESGGTLVLPISTAPALFNRATAVASFLGTWFESGDRKSTRLN